MEEGTEIPQISNLKVKKPLQLNIKSCFPEETSLEEQIAKVDEEMQEVAKAKDVEKIARELLDVAVAAVGGAEIAMRKAAENGEIPVPQVLSIQQALQTIISNKYKEKQDDFAEHEKCGVDTEVIE